MSNEPYASSIVRKEKIANNNQLKLKLTYDNIISQIEFEMDKMHIDFILLLWNNRPTVKKKSFFQIMMKKIPE